MGLVQNLKKRLGRLAERILVELSYLYIIQKEKQTLKNPDSSLHTEFLQSPLTTEHQSTIIATSSQGTSEKITMEMTTDDIVAYTREWAINKVDESESILLISSISPSITLNTPESKTCFCISQGQ